MGGVGECSVWQWCSRCGGSEGNRCGCCWYGRVHGCRYGGGVCQWCGSECIVVPGYDLTAPSSYDRCWNSSNRRWRSDQRGVENSSRRHGCYEENDALRKAIDLKIKYLIFFPYIYIYILGFKQSLDHLDRD